LAWTSRRALRTNNTQRRRRRQGCAWDAAELIRQIDPEWTDPSGGHRVALAFLCPDPAGVDAKYEELADLGFGHRDPWDAFWGQRYASVLDPDGNQVDLFAPL
jgi:uncharacterized glyoxalase superfamily protein PhnB